MSQVDVHEAKSHFSKLLVRVAAGEEIVIARAEGLKIADDLDAPPPPELHDSFYEGRLFPEGD